MFQSTISKQKKKCVSYGSYETNVQKMEEELMNHFSYNYSQLHKSLVREKYYQLKTVL
ncbi:hypothetical protein SynBOUM118_02320 [Synechococcus sp. BOUM118]|nr:hypothetical protein SynBOUM118_02320 [Synechococcus sp. BOUM118]